MRYAGRRDPRRSHDLHRRLADQARYRWRDSCVRSSEIRRLQWSEPSRERPKGPISVRCLGTQHVSGWKIGCVRS